MELHKRLAKIKKLKEKVDSILLLNTNANFFYFTNSDISGFFFYDFSKTIVYTNKMEFTRAKKSWVKPEINSLKNFLKEIKGKKIGIDFKGIDAYLYKKIKKKIKCVDISEDLEKIRSMKTQYEIKQITRTCSLSKQVFQKIKINGTEKKLQAELNYQINKIGDTAFPTIVASGLNIKYPHHHPTKNKIKKPVLIDFGIRYNGYVSDVTRTIGSKYEEIIRKTIEKLEKNLVPDIKASTLDVLARKQLGKYAKYFITALGHGIGVDIHEKPYITKNSKDILKPGMTIAIEPGIYIKNGIRIENDYIITKNGFKKLTNF